MTKSESHVAKLTESVIVIKVAIGFIGKQSLCDCTRTMMNLSEHLPLVLTARVKYTISQLSVSANVEGRM